MRKVSPLWRPAAAKRAPRPGRILTALDTFLEIPESVRPGIEVTQLLEDHEWLHLRWQSPIYGRQEWEDQFYRVVTAISERIRSRQRDTSRNTFKRSSAEENEEDGR